MDLFAPQQIIRAIVKNPLDLTKVSLIYANVNPTDILLKAELDQLAKDHPTRFSVYYVLNNPPENWDGGVGFVSQEMIKEKLPPAAADMKMLLCGQSRPSPILCLRSLLCAGPPPMLTAMKRHLDALGFEKPNTISKMPDQVFCF